jgi:hypothetical protein
MKNEKNDVERLPFPTFFVENISDENWWRNYSVESGKIHFKICLKVLKNPQEYTLGWEGGVLQTHKVQF